MHTRTSEFALTHSLTRSLAALLLRYNRQLRALLQSERWSGADEWKAQEMVRDDYIKIIENASALMDVVREQARQNKARSTALGMQSRREKEQREKLVSAAISRPRLFLAQPPSLSPLPRPPRRGNPTASPRSRTPCGRPGSCA